MSAETQLVAAIVDSFVFMDATRSHEANPYLRLRERAQTRRHVRYIAIGCFAMAILFTVSAFSH